MFDDVYITAMSVLAPGATSPSAFAQLLASKTSALSPRVPGRADQGWIGRVDLVDMHPPNHQGSRALSIAKVVAAGLSAQLKGDEVPNIPLFLGTVQGAYWGDAKASPQELARPNDRGREPGVLASTIAEGLGLGGGHQTLGMACVSSAAAILLAAEWVSRGQGRQAIAGGVEALSPMVLQGFEGLGALGRGLPRPFDVHREGMTLSEGGGLLLIEGRESAQRGGRALSMRILSGGEATDAHRLASPHPEGRGGALAAGVALRGAGLAASSISLIQGHGTGTLPGDRAEARGLYHAGLRAPLQGLKGYFGHALGATGALETIAMALQYQQGSLAPTLGFREADPEVLLPIVTTSDPSCLKGPALLSWYAFGGNQVTLVVSSPEGS